MAAKKKARSKKKTAATPPRSKPSDDHLRALQLAAETRCIFSAEPVDLRHLVDEEGFAGVTIQQLRAWADAGSWAQRRSRHLAQLRQQVQSKLSVALRKSRLQHLRSLRQLEYQGLMMLSDPNLVPKNGWESMANAVSRLGERIEKMQVSIGQEASVGLAAEVPVAQHGDLPSEMLPELTDDEARAAARAVVEMRRHGGVPAETH